MLASVYRYKYIYNMYRALIHGQGYIINLMPTVLADYRPLLLLFTMYHCSNWTWVVEEILAFWY